MKTDKQASKRSWEVFNAGNAVSIPVNKGYFELGWKEFFTVDDPDLIKEIRNAKDTGLAPFIEIQETFSKNFKNKAKKKTVKKKTVKKDSGELSNLKFPELRKLANEKGINVPFGIKKSELIANLKGA
jgi:hypothetical protein